MTVYLEPQSFRKLVKVAKRNGWVLPKTGEPNMSQAIREMIEYEHGDIG